MIDIPALLNLQDPKMVGSSEYHAIYDVLENAQDKDEAIGILEEFRDRATSILADLNQPTRPL